MDAQKPQARWMFFWDESGNNSSFQVNDACVAAMETLNVRGNSHVAPMHFGGCQLASNPEKHPDAQVLSTWLAANGRQPTELPVIFWLAYFVRNEWANFPKRTNTEHRALYHRIATLCRDLRDAMDETGLPYLDGEGGLKAVNVFSLLTDSEISSIPSACDHVRGLPDVAHDLDAAQRRMLDIFLTVPVVGLPTMGTLLDRVAGEAQQIEHLGPLHAQPNKRGAERGYFVRRIGELFQRRYGEQPHEVIAALTTIALGEATDRELVAKLLT